MAVAFAKFLAVLLPGVSDTIVLSLGSVRLPGASSAIPIGVSPQRVVAIASILLLTWINFRGVSLGARIQTTLTIAKVGALGALIVLGLLVFRQPDAVLVNFGAFWGTAPWTLALVPLVGAAMVGSLFSSDAWNNVTFAAAEVRNPTRNLPLALAAGTALVTVCYLLANLAYLCVLPLLGDPNGATATLRGIQYATSDRVGTAAVEVMLGPAGGVVMAVAIIISTLGCNAGLILAGPRVYYAMARDRLFERAGHLHLAYHTPGWGSGSRRSGPRCSA